MAWGKTILVIEDNAEMMESLAAILELAGYKVKTALDGRSGVDIACQVRPDLILCDVMMPGLDGFEVLHLLNKYMDQFMMPFIFLTAKAGLDDMRRGMNLGADDYITKPFDGHELLKVIEMRLPDADFYQRMHSPDFQKLLENRPIRKYKKKDVIYAEGQHPTEMYFIYSGNVKTFKRSGRGKELIMGIYGEGDSIGYVPLIHDMEHQEDAVSISETELVPILKQDFLSSLYSNREIARKYIALLSNNLKEAQKRLVEMAYQSVRQKVVGALLRIHGQNDRPPNRRKAMISVSRKDLSNLSGIATESVNRTLSDFKEKGLIDFAKGGILLVNKTALTALLK